MEQYQSDIRELLQLYNSAVELKKRAEKKLIRFTNSLKEVDRKNCGNEIIDEINVVRSRIKADRQQQAEQTVRNSYAQMQNQMVESTTSLKHQLQAKELCNKFSYSKELEQLELNYNCQIQQQQQVINELKLQFEEIRENNEEQILSLTEKNQQLLTLIEDLNKQIAELKSALEQYQNEEFKFLQLNNSNQLGNLRNSQPLEVVKKRNTTADSMEQCQFDTLASEMRYEENSNYDREIMLGSSNKELEDTHQQLSEIDGTIGQLKVEIQTLQWDKEMLLEQLQEKVELQNQVEILTQTVASNKESYTQQISILQNNNQLLEQQINEQKEQIEFQYQIQQNESTLIIEQLKKQNQLFMEQKEELIIQIQNKDLLLSELQESNAQLDSNLKQKQSQIDILFSDLQCNQILFFLELKQQNKDSLEKDKQSQTEAISLNKENFPTQQQQEQLNLCNGQNSNEVQLQENQQVQQSLVDLGQERNQLLESISDLQNKLDGLQLENQKFLEEKQQLIKKFNQQQESFDALLTQTQEKTEQILLFDTQKKSLLEEQQKLTDQLKNFELINSTQEQSHVQSLNQIENLQSQLQQAQKASLEQENKLQIANKKLDEFQEHVKQFKLEKEQHEQQINSLANKVEDLLLLSNNKDDQIKVLEEELQNRQEQCDKLTEQYAEDLKQMQDQLGKSVENIKQHSGTSSPVKDDKFKDQINRLNDELRRSQLQIAQYSTINSSLKQQLKEIAIKLQILLKIQPNEHQDLNELVLLIENNLSSCQSSPVKPLKKTSMNDATKLFLNKARQSAGSVRGSLRQNTINDGRRSHQFQTPNSSSAVEFDQILNDSDM